MDIGRADKESEMEEQAKGLVREIWKRGLDYGQKKRQKS